MHFQKFFQSFTGSLDRHFSDNSGLEPDDPQKEICAAVSAELYCRAGFGTEIDIHETWVHTLPVTLPLRFVYFFAGYLLISTGIALSNRCKMPIIPTDLFPRELADITKAAYSRIKISYDVICLSVTALLTFVCLGQIRGLGIGTVLAAFTMGKVIGKIGEGMDKKVRFVSIFSK